MDTDLLALSFCLTIMIQSWLNLSIFFYALLALEVYLEYTFNQCTIQPLFEWSLNYCLHRDDQRANVFIFFMF